MALTPRQSRFVAEYLKDLNATQAAIRTGYSPKTAASQASSLLRNPKVRDAVDAGKKSRAKRLELSADAVLGDIVRLSEKAEETGELATALKGRELLGKHLALFTEKHQLAGADGGPLSFVVDLRGGK